MKTAWGTLSITKFYIVLSKTSFKVLIQSRSFVSNFTNTSSDKVLANDTFLLSTWQNKYESFICFFLRLSALITTIKVVFLLVRFWNLYHTFLIYFIDNSNILKLMGFKNNRCKNFPSRFNSKAHLVWRISRYLNWYQCG